MARIRTVKPDFWTDEKVGRLKREVRLLYIGLWNLADDQGVLKNNSNYIKGQLFSYDDDLRVNTVNDWLASLVKARMLVPFEHQNESYYIIRTFHEHQLINRPSKPKFSEDFLLSVKNTHGVLSEYSLPEGNGMERKGEGEPAPEVFKNKGEEVFFTIEHCAVVALNDTRWTTANKTSEKELKEFNSVLEKRGVYEKNPMDYKSHFASWKLGGKKDEPKNKSEFSAPPLKNFNAI